MVKLIAADMDGTLLDDQKRLPNGFPKLLECLAKRGVAFAVASGRSYPALQMLFGKKTEELLLICDNGAHVRIPGKAPVYQCMPFSVVHAVLDLCRNCRLLFRFCAGWMGFITQRLQNLNLSRK